jgi:hypothetical protein
VLQAAAGGDAIHFYSNTGGGNGAGIVGDAQNVLQLYRYLSGTLSPPTGDQPCNQGNPLVTHICYVRTDAPSDTRDLFSVRGDSLAPGESRTFVIANLFAAPVVGGGCGPAACAVPPGNPLRLTDPVALSMGANTVDSIAGFRGYADLNSDGVVQGGEVRAVPRSLLQKAQIAQAIFDSKFLLPQAPIAPDFFVIPGDNTVTVLWRPSETETVGDPYFASASRPRAANGVEINPLYDPNYRLFDVEGYRLYRSRTPDFREAVLLGQWDYAGTAIRDYTGRVNRSAACAPELGVRTGCPTLDSLVPGEPLVGFTSFALSGALVQVRDGDRIRASDGFIYPQTADTIGKGDSPGDCLCDSGVPFQFVDNTVRNGLTYYYAVTAFDVNSLQSGPSSMESPRQLRKATPKRPAINVATSGDYTVTLEGRRALDTLLPVPTLDPVTGRFSGPFPPANGWRSETLSLVYQLYAGHYETRIHLDSITLGQFLLSPANNPRLFFTVTSGGVRQTVTAPLEQNGGSIDRRERSTQFAVLATDSALTARYGGRAASAQLNLVFALPGAYAMGVWGRGAINTGQPMLSNVNTVYQPRSYVTMGSAWRMIDYVTSTARRAADYNVYWGASGRIDSVVDVTHDVPVPFSQAAGGSWGILNTTAQGNGGYDNRPDVLTPADWTCVEPMRTLPTEQLACAASAPFVLSQRAELGTIAFAAGEQVSTTGPGSVRNPANVAALPGFALYLAGNISQFELAALPAAGTVWSLRDYTGVILGTPETGYTFQPAVRPMAAVGTDIVVRADIRNTLVQARDRDLRLVHTVPDPYYLQSDLEEGEGIRFVNLPARATIRIYSASGVLVQLLDHESPLLAGDAYWNLRTRNGQRVASGVYFYHVESGDARRVGRMTIVNYTN